ncbi:MAG: beta-phosphoglucomutase [Anaerolineales bacterium]
MSIRAFLFDLDGVLTDTAEYHYRAWKRLADELGIPFTREENEALRGIPRRESLLLLLKGRTYPEAQMQEFMARKNNYYLQFIREITPRDVLPGALELLEEIRASGLKSALGSASKNAREVIERLGIAALLDAVSDGNSVERQKPAPDLFLHAARQLGFPPRECVVVEDASAGIEAALAGGFWTLAIGPASRFSTAHVVLPSLEHVKLRDLLAFFDNANFSRLLAFSSGSSQQNTPSSH